MINTLPVLALLAFAAPAPTPEDARVLTGIVASAAAEAQGVEVLTAGDLRATLDIEASRQMAGCTEASCLAQIAQAIDARVAITGTLGALGDETVLELSVIDVRDARALRRRSLRAPNAAGLAAPAEALVRDALTSAALPKATRVLVLDFELARGPIAANEVVAPEPAADAGAGGFLLPVGLGAAGVGLLGLVAGAGLDFMSVSGHAQTTDDLSLTASDANRAYDQSDGYAAGAVVAYVAGAVFVAGGVTLSVIGLLE